MTERRKISQLSNHPRQELYGNLNARQFQALKDDIRNNGQLQPILVSQDGVIVDGHHRVQILREFGHDEVDAIVLDDGDPDYVESRFLAANFHRRQLSILDQARIVEAFLDLECRQQCEQLSGERLRQRLAEELGLSSRTIARHLQLLRLPRPIQDAVSNKRLSMTSALKLEALGDEKLEEIAAEIVAGESPRTLAHQYLGATSRQPPPASKAEPETPADRYNQLMHQLDAYIDDLVAANAETLAGTAMPSGDAAALLARLVPFLSKMKEYEQQRHDHEAPITISGRVARHRRPDTVSGESA